MAPFVTLSVGVSGLAAQSQAWADDFFASAVVGTWKGAGIVYGNEVQLEREWSFDLAGTFLRADMRVTMANGAGFRVLSFWRPEADDRYAVTWMDELGQSLALDASADAEGRKVTTHYLDATGGSEPRWRRLVFRITGENSYVEIMHTETREGWEQIAEFWFERIETGSGDEGQAARR